MRAAIFAGGRGTRLNKLRGLPKCLIPVVEIPIIDRILNVLIKSHITEVFLLVAYKEKLIREHFSKKLKYSKKAKINFIRDEMLGTLNAFHKLKDIFKNENFLLLDGDSLFASNIFNGLIKYSKKINFDLIKCITDNRSHIDYKVVVDKQNRILDYGKNINGDHLEAGISVCSPTVFKETSRALDNGIESFGDFTTYLLKGGYKIMGYMIPEFYDIDTLKDLKKAEKFIQKVRK
jgi:NDP-sugar pyrophosphorylase family protein